MKKVTSRIVARVAGVSQSTVSKVINNNPEVAAETARRVIRAAHELDYPLIPRGGRPTVAVIIPEYVFAGYIAEMLSALTRELLRRGIRLEMVFDTHLELLSERCVSGAIALSWDRQLNARWGSSFLAPLIRINAPGSHAENCWSVCYDGRRSLENLVERLWKLGHRRIGFFFFNSREHEETNVAERFQGFVAAMNRRGDGTPERFCRFDCFRSQPEELAAELDRWQRQGVTALIAANELANVVLDRVVRLLDLKIPEELSLVSWEMPGGSEFFTPPRTTLSVAPEQVCRAAADLLENCLSPDASPEDVLIPYRLIERASVGPAPAR